MFYCFVPHLPPAVLAYIYREKGSAVPFPRVDHEVEACGMYSPSFSAFYRFLRPGTAVRK